MSIVLEYSTELWDEATMRRLGSHLKRLLKAAAAAPDTAVGRLRMLPQSEMRQIEQWSIDVEDFGTRECALPACLR